MIEKSAGYTSNGKDFHARLEDAQKAALVEIFAVLDKGPIDPALIAEFTMNNAPAILEVLATKHRGRPRNTKGATAMRKAKLRTAALPLAEKEAQP